MLECDFRAKELKVPSPSERTMGFSERKYDPGQVRQEWDVSDERFNNPFGTVQGGFLAVFADDLMGAALATLSDPDERFAMAELKVSFLQPACEGKLVGEGKVLRKGKHTAFLSAEIRDEDDEVIANATGTAVIIKIGTVSDLRPQD